MRALLIVVALAFLGCRGGDPADPDGGGGGDDAPDASGVGCTPTDPRSTATQVFIGPSGLEQRLAGYIDSAQESLWIQMYLFTVDSLADRVVAAKNRGVEVRVLLDPDHKGNPDVRGQFTGAGVPVRDAASMFTFSHAKYLIIDGDTAVIMSANLNYGAMDSERNYGAVVTDPDDLADLIAIFESDWTQQGFADLGCTRLVVSPVNARMRYLQLINAATERLDLSVIYLSDSSVRTAVIQAHDRGVAVRVLLSDPADFPDNNDTVTTLENQGVPVRVITTVSLHAKLIIADGVAVIGSQNLSTTSLTQNREVGVQVTDAVPVETIQTQFDADWAAGR